MKTDVHAKHSTSSAIELTSQVFRSNKRNLIYNNSNKFAKSIKDILLFILFISVYNNYKTQSVVLFLLLHYDIFSDLPSGYFIFTCSPLRSISIVFVSVILRFVIAISATLTTFLTISNCSS